MCKEAYSRTALATTQHVFDVPHALPQCKPKGKQRGFDGDRSVLFYHVVRLAKCCLIKYVFLENVCFLDAFEGFGWLELANRSLYRGGLARTSYPKPCLSTREPDSCAQGVHI